MTDEEIGRSQSVHKLYEQRLDERRALAARLERRHAVYGRVRLVLALVAIGIVVTSGLRTPGWLLFVGALFIVVAVLHARLLGRRAKAVAAVAFYERGLRRIRHEWIGTGRTGDAYRPNDHPYADDLDLFGRGGLFELLATMRTKAGEETLARWLTTPATGDEARSRQTAVAELSGRLDLRESVATLGDDVRAAVDAPILRRWAAAPLQMRSPAARIALGLLAGTTSTLVVWWFQTGDFGTATAVVVLGQALVAWWLRGRVRGVIESVEEPSHDLDVLASLLRLLERERFTSPHLAALGGKLGAGRAASVEIAALASLVAMLSSRRNALFAIPAAFLLWGTQWAFAIEAWRGRAGRKIPQWLEVIGEFETLVALGGHAAEHPEYVYPEIVDGPPQIEATALAHPTLGPAAIGNDIALSADRLRLVIVSGSNMSGKSTWLRTIGASVVLAGMGAPVRASTCRLSPLEIGAAIRVLDSLTDGRSRFFAEITRLKAIVDLTRERQGAVLFLLDEILSGTNSHDRRVGAEALIGGLLSAGAIGLVTTHDLAIGDIVDRLDGQAVNAHFADQFDEGTLRFDYRLAPGVVRTSNALALMRSIGLDV